MIVRNPDRIACDVDRSRINELLECCGPCRAIIRATNCVGINIDICHHSPIMVLRAIEYPHPVARGPVTADQCDDRESPRDPVILHPVGGRLDPDDVAQRPRSLKEHRPILDRRRSSMRIEPRRGEGMHDYALFAVIVKVETVTVCPLDTEVLSSPMSGVGEEPVVSMFPWIWPTSVGEPLVMRK